MAPLKVVNRHGLLPCKLKCMNGCPVAHCRPATRRLAWCLFWQDRGRGISRRCGIRASRRARLGTRAAGLTTLAGALISVPRITVQPPCKRTQADVFLLVRTS
ncbi:hypothetical protein IF2G_00581 [Cordyceps javanica]|nr:hypothetical protein IF2G_00581 [Cordyceps javanica]